jgi:glutamate racemase
VKRPRIGVFDSGVGGLTVLSSLASRLPNADYHYLGDTGRVPYGSRSQENIISYSRECLGYLARFNVDLLVVACNTSSAIALPHISADFEVPVVGVIEDGVAAALDASTRGVLILGTRATIGSGVYQRRILDAGKGLEVWGLACPLFVPIVEEGWADTPIAEAAAHAYFSTLSDCVFDVVLLGCTHFPIMQQTLRRMVGENVQIEDPSVRVAERVAGFLPQAARAATPDIHFHVTDSPDGFMRVAQAMGMHVTTAINHVDLSI